LVTHVPALQSLEQQSLGDLHDAPAGPHTEVTPVPPPGGFQPDGRPSWPAEQAATMAATAANESAIDERVISPTVATSVPVTRREEFA
jgi:hypothetical protein